MFGVRLGPEIREQRADGGGVGGEDRRQLAQNVGEVGGHVEVVQPRALDDGIQDCRGLAAAQTAEE